MGDNSTIEWTDATWNPVVGCTRISEGCRHCYAFELHDKRHAAVKAGKELPVQYAKPFSEIQLFWDRIKQPLHWRRPRRIFVNSLSDLFHKDVPVGFIVNVFKAMEMCPQHIFQILTKRADRMQEIISYLSKHWKRPFPLPNVWLGVSVEDQTVADQRIPFLLKTPAAVRWLSIEPLLGPIDLARYLWCEHHEYDDIVCPMCGQARDNSAPLNWVVVGGESGPGARPMHPDWVRALRFQCNSACVPFFFKQWGNFIEHGGCDDPCGQCVIALPDATLTGFDWTPGRHLAGGVQLHRVSKKSAGRVLDGRTWDEFPTMTGAQH